MSIYPFIEAEKANKQPNVAKACALLGVSRSAFYDWHRHEPSARQVADDELAGEIQAVYDRSRGTYGWPRVHAQLRRQGICVSRKRVARLMRQRGLVGRCRRRWTKTTIPDPDVTGAVDRLKRAFGPGTVEVDRVYVGDITYIRTWEGWAYLATVIDLASRRIVGWAVDDHMRASLVCDALQIAITHRRPPPGLVFHSDRGTQGGFNWSSQHLDEEVEHGKASWLDEGVDGAVSDEVAGCAVASSRDGASVLACDRDWGHERGGRCRGRGVPGGWEPLVPAWWRDATDASGRADRPLSVVRRA